MSKESPAARLFHLMYPKSNYYGAPPEQQRKMQEVAKEFEEFIKSQNNSINKVHMDSEGDGK